MSVYAWKCRELSWRYCNSCLCVVSLKRITEEREEMMKEIERLKPVQSKRTFVGLQSAAQRMLSKFIKTTDVNNEDVDFNKTQ